MDKTTILKKAKENNLTVEWSDWLISARVQNLLLINPNLLKYDKFCNDTLAHEFKHTGKMTKNDLWIDMVEGSIIDTLVFCFRHPKAFARFIPIAIYKKELQVDVNTIIIYFVIGGLLFFILRM